MYKKSISTASDNKFFVIIFILYFDIISRVVFLLLLGFSSRLVLNSALLPFSNWKKKKTSFTLCNIDSTVQQKKNAPIQYYIINSIHFDCRRYLWWYCITIFFFSFFLSLFLIKYEWMTFHPHAITLPIITNVCGRVRGLINLKSRSPSPLYLSLYK